MLAMTLIAALAAQAAPNDLRISGFNEDAILSGYDDRRTRGFNEAAAGSYDDFTTRHVNEGALGVYDDPRTPDVDERAVGRRDNLLTPDVDEGAFSAPRRPGRYGFANPFSSTDTDPFKREERSAFSRRPSAF